MKKFIAYLSKDVTVKQSMVVSYWMLWLACTLAIVNDLIELF